LITLGSILAAGVTYAEQCPPITGGDATLEHVDAAVRLDFIRSTLADQARRASFWNWSWRGIFAASTVYSVAISQTSNDGSTTRAAYADAAKSAIGTISKFVDPLRIEQEESGTQEGCSSLAEAEAALLQSARNQQRGKGLLTHAGVLGLNLASSLVLVFGYGDSREALISGAVGALAGEIMIYTQPNGAMRALKRYKAGDVPRPRSAGLSVGVVPMVGTETVGLTLTMRFR
jgi:hypothetical protein